MGYPIPVVTCTVYHDSQFLVIRRRDDAKKYGGLWGFPGGKVEPDETISRALRREVLEETGLRLKDKILFVDSYYYKDSLGLHFAAYTDSVQLRQLEGYEYQWLDSLKDLQKLQRIPGIDYHVKMVTTLMRRKVSYLSLKALDYTPDKYIN